MSYLLFLLFIISDRLSKYYIINNFELGESQILIDRFLHITYVRNTGIAFGLLAGRGWLLIVLQALVIILLLFLKISFFPSQLFINLCFVALLAGATGNLMDRILYGYVVDFIDVGFWPVFNLADIFIVVGALGLVYLIIKEEFQGNKLISGF